MSFAVAGCGDTQITEGEFDVIEACQHWLELDFPDQSDTEPVWTVPNLSEGEPR